MTARAFLLFLVLGAIVAGGSFSLLRCEGTPPGLEGPEEILVGLKGTTVTLGAGDERSGLRSLRAILVHAKGDAVLIDRGFPGSLLTGAITSPSDERVDLSLDAKAMGVPPGNAVLRVEARDWSWRDGFGGNLATLEIPVEIDLKRPRIQVENGLTYLWRGGSGAVVYSLNEQTSLDGVQVGDDFFPGYAFPDEAPEATHRRRLALFAIPRSAEEETPVLVVATDRVGNRASTGWATRIKIRAFDEVEIRLPASFLKVKVPVLAEEVGIEAENALAAFQEINTEIREKNEIQIREIVANSAPERLWKGAFEQLRNSQVTSRFAEHRTYRVGGEKVSEAIHYGFDLAATAQSPITAANGGRVVYADALGIYGNCVVIDHGIGLSSLYAHLSRIDVVEGDEVSKGQTLGSSGATGLAGGDHLHFAILVGETYVNPVEWWDPKWVREHIEVRFEVVGP